MRNNPSHDSAGSRRRRKEEAVAAILREYRSCGLTQRVFAQAAGISVSTLQLWRRRARLGFGSPVQRAGRAAAAPVVSLLEVKVEDAAPLGGGAPVPVRYEIELGNGARLRVPPAFGEADVRRLLGLLQEVR